MMQVEENNMDKNVQAWSEYADEYNANTLFSSEVVHTGLGLAGVSPSFIVKTSGSILDIGCGNGINTFLLAKQTSGSVVGVDPVSSQICSATERFKRSNLSFMCCEFQDLLNHITDHYDLITFFGSIDYIPIDEFFFTTIDRITHSGSRCFLSKFHSFWTTLYGNDVKEELDNSYFENGRRDIVGFGQSEFIRYHYTLSDFIMRFAKHGWILREFMEPKPELKNSAFGYKNYEQDPILQHRLSKIPMTAVFEYVKEI